MYRVGRRTSEALGTETTAGSLRRITIATGSANLLRPGLIAAPARDLAVAYEHPDGPTGASRVFMRADPPKGGVW